MEPWQRRQHEQRRRDAEARWKEQTLCLKTAQRICGNCGNEDPSALKGLCDSCAGALHVYADSGGREGF